MAETYHSEAERLICVLYARGMSLTAIGAAIGRSDTTIRNIYHRRKGANTTTVYRLYCLEQISHLKPPSKRKR